MFGFFKRKKNEEDKFSKPLSPEADKFLAEALEEYGEKEDALEQGWRLSACADYELDDGPGVLRVKLNDGTSWEADAQILGSFNEADREWQWAWGSPECSEVWSRDSKVVQEVGKQLDIWYLHELWAYPLPGPEFVAYLCAIGMKASESTGMFEARDGSVVIFVMLKNLRWSSGAAEGATAGGARETVGDLTETIRLIKAGQEHLLPGWITQFGQSQVYVISKDSQNPGDLFIIGPKEDKNYIAVFTDQAGLDAAVEGHRDVLFPLAINGKELIEQARDTGRGLIINPKDQSATVPLPANMMEKFLEVLG